METYDKKESTQQEQIDQKTQMDQEWRPACFEFFDLNYSVKKPKPKQILQNLHGRIEKGKLTAIMGGSGSGKSSLLECLTMRVKVTGSLLMNGKNYSSDDLLGAVAFVMQDDTLFEYLTVRETLTFAAKLRLPSKMPAVEKKKRIDEVIQQLGLARCADSTIGGFLRRGISGGEKRRVSIGQSILLQPEVLLLDEPTSGLDSFTALHTTELIKSLVDKGITVVCTIHQPSAQIFELFESVILLCRGQCVYSGPLEGMESYFKLGGHIMPPYVNPADMYVDWASFDERTDEAADASIHRIKVLTELSQRLQSGKVPMTQVPFSEHMIIADSASLPRPSSDYAPSHSDGIIKVIPLNRDQKTNALKTREQFKHQWWQEFLILSHRYFLERSRNPQYIVSSLLQATLMGVMMGALFYNLDHKIPSVRDRESLIFLSNGLYPYAIMLAVVSMFQVERPILVREQRDGLYAVSAWYAARSLVEWPVYVVAAMLFVVPMYFMSNFLRTVSAFFRFWLMTYLNIYIYESVGVLAGSLSQTVTGAAMAVNFVFLLTGITAGFFIPFSHLSPMTQWMSWLNWVKYLYIASVRTEFETFVLDCSGAVECPSNASSYGQYVIQQQGADVLEYWQCALILVAFLVTVRSATCGALMFRYRRRKSGG